MAVEAAATGRGKARTLGFGPGDQLALAAYWFALNFHWGALLTIVVPTQILTYVPEAGKTQALGLAVGWGALVAMVVQPLAGALSDRLRPRMGRRPFVVVGALSNAAALLLLAYAPTYWWLFAGVLLVQLTNNVAGAAYQGYIPDLVPPERRGVASGYMGFMTMLGNILGVGLAGFMVAPGHTAGFCWVIVAVLLAAMLVTIWRVPENREGQAPDWQEFVRSWTVPLRAPDFIWLFITRALVMLSFYVLLVFIEYFMKDVLRPDDYVQSTSYVTLFALLGATASTIAAGRLSDRLGRRGLVCAAGSLMAVTAAAFALVPVWAFILIAAVLFGIGYGAYTSVDWALAVDVLPSRNDAARDLGIWSIASTLPQVLAPVVGGFALSVGASLGPGLDYPALFGLSFLAAALGSAFVWRIRGAR